MRDRCEYCETPYGDDRDENGLPFCECDAAEVDRLRTAIAKKDAEIERLSAIIRAVEWVRYNQEYAVSDGFLACPICDNDFLLGHQDECPFYKWKGGGK